MNLQQFEYIDALERTGHFGQAAAACFVTQPTLSMMIKKLEEELGVQIFYRDRQPITPTREGAEIIAHGRRILHQTALLRDYVSELREEVSGTLRIGIIPTLAPYLAPLFLQKLAEEHPRLHIAVKEALTDDLMVMLKKGEADAALAATPLHDPALREERIFDEELWVYAGSSEGLSAQTLLTPQDINLEHLWLLEEGHCLRVQVYDLCRLRELHARRHNLNYEAGSIETLINLVDAQGGVTIIPALAARLLSSEQRPNLYRFCEPQPMREISLVSLNVYPRKRLLARLLNCIKSNIPRQAGSPTGDVVSPTQTGA
ncbi:MAG: LysR substrate-binding domain-containing protein [Saprospiraceae bacterium]